MKAVLISDLHFDRVPNKAISLRKGEFADILLLRTVHRINRFIKPDVVLVAGDFIDKPSLPGASDLLTELKTILDKLNCPYIAIPGNHDPVPDTFYSIFKKPDIFTDIAGVRFVSFPFDKEEADFNASRSRQDIQLIKGARKDFSGPIVSFQHVPLFPLGFSECPYNYINAKEIVKVMKSCAVGFSSAGHYHEGFMNICHDSMSFTAVPALCEDPFRFIVMEIQEDGSSSFKMHQLKNNISGLTDFHIHTDLAYCNENMQVSKIIELKKMMGLQNAAFSEHSGHLYFDRETYGSGRYIFEDAEKVKNHRFDLYFQRLEEAGAEIIPGIEIDSGFGGIPVVKKEHFHAFKIRIGAVHQLSELLKSDPDREMVIREFMTVLEVFLKSGIDVLAHPFRIFRRKKMEISPELFVPLAVMLKENRVAAEINFHTNEPPLEFFRICLENNVKLSFGSDAHNLYEVGEFYPHIEFMKKLVPETDIAKFLINL